MSNARKILQPHRVSNSFCKEELEVLAQALQRAEEFANLPGGLVGEDYEVLTQVVQIALRGGDISGIVRSGAGRRAFAKLEGLRRWSRADLTAPAINDEAQTTVTERVTKMLARARQQDVIQATSAEGPVPCE